MNYLDLLNLKYRTHSIFISVVLLITVLVIYIFQLEIYDIYNTYGYISNETINFNVSCNDPDIIANIDNIKINNKNYTYKIENISTPLIDQNTLSSYQEVKINSKTELLNNTIVNITIYYNKEKVYKKIQKLIF